MSQQPERRVSVLFDLLQVLAGDNGRVSRPRCEEQMMQFEDRAGEGLLALSKVLINQQAGPDCGSYHPDSIFKLFLSIYLPLFGLK